MKQIDFTTPHKFCRAKYPQPCEDEYEYGCCTSPYVELKKFDPEGMNNLDEIVAPENIVILVDYPLNFEFRFTFEHSKPYTRKELATEICQLYQQIYKDEIESLMNEKYGKYGMRRSLEYLLLRSVVLERVEKVDGKDYNVYSLIISS